MFFKRFAVVTAAVGSLAIVVIALLSPHSALSKALPFSHSSPANSISGLPGGDGPVLVVKIDDTPEAHPQVCLLYTSPSPRDRQKSRMPSSA